jgi:predicted DsbA family dithiol-disulfide isomerase
MVVSAHKPNTRRALALAEWARDRGALHPVRRGIMDAYWRRGLDVEDPAVLAAVAAAAGLDGAAAVKGSEAPGILERVAKMGQAAARAGVTGIPTFDVGGERVVGAQPYEVLEAAVLRAARRGGVTAPRGR